MLTVRVFADSKQPSPAELWHRRLSCPALLRVRASPQTAQKPCWGKAGSKGNQTCFSDYPSSPASLLTLVGYFQELWQLHFKVPDAPGKSFLSHKGIRQKKSPRNKADTASPQDSFTFQWPCQDTVTDACFVCF